MDCYCHGFFTGWSVTQPTVFACRTFYEVASYRVRFIDLFDQ